MTALRDLKLDEASIGLLVYLAVAKWRDQRRNGASERLDVLQLYLPLHNGRIA